MRLATEKQRELLKNMVYFLGHKELDVGDDDDLTLMEARDLISSYIDEYKTEVNSRLNEYRPSLWDYFMGDVE